MEYNWGDPKKNSLLTSRMMAKAEITRKKRLTSVKSTLSKQLHPAIEHKLRKRKNPNSARRHLECEDDNSQSSCTHNDTHDTDQWKTEPQLASDEESSTLDTIRHDAFPIPAYSSSMFDEFGLNAAADGLFHPASTIEAFTEHDAKYRQEIKSASNKPHSGPRRARARSEYPPSRENHRLPALHSGKTKTTRPGSKLQSTSNIGSAPASIRATSSLSMLLNADEVKRSLSATQSDSKLYAPRRMDVVPSSADRNALDFLEREFESDNNPQISPESKSSQAASALDDNQVPDNGSSVPPLDISLAKKFEKLKRIMTSNREKHNSNRENSEQPNEVPPGKLGTGQPTADHPKASSRTERSTTRSAIRASSSGSSGPKNSGVTASTAKAVPKKRSTPAARTTVAMNNNISGSKRVLGNRATGAASRKASPSVAVTIAPPVRSKKEMKVRSGVSLSDLKAEHREALQMLKELGGPVDPDYLHVHVEADIDSNVSKGHRSGKTIARTTGADRSSGSTLALADRNSTSQLQPRVSPSTPPTSANSGVSMVTKLRESISSGRISRECSPRIDNSGETGDSPTTLSGRKEEDRVPLGNNDSSSNQTLIQDPASDIATALDKAALVSEDVIGSSLPPALSPNKNSSDPWKQYENDTIDDEDEDNNELEHDSNSEVNTVRAAGYSDEDFESDR